MNKAIKGWKNIPIFVVITKSYSKPDIEENISTIKSYFDKNNKYFLKASILLDFFFHYFSPLS